VYRALRGGNPLSEEKLMSNILAFHDHPEQQKREQRLDVMRKKKQRMIDFQSSSSSKRSNVRHEEDEDAEELKDADD
jgi:hypothetical protein